MSAALRCDFGSSDEDEQETRAAVFALIDDCEGIELPASPATDCTDEPDENDENDSDDTQEYSRGDQPPKDMVVDAPAAAAMTKEERAARRAERKNLARLKRYHRTREELVMLRRQSVEFEALLKKLVREESQHPPPSLKTGPCPFTDDSDDEVDPSNHSSMKLLVSGRLVPESDWKSTALREHRHRKRAAAVNRMLKRLVRIYQEQTHSYVQNLSTTQKSLQPTIPRTDLPSLPGCHTVEAFAYGGIVLLRELYRKACLSHRISPVASLAQQRCGDELAYLSLLGPDIEGCWTHDFSLPGCSSPGEVAATMRRAMSLEPKDSTILEASFKEHSILHPLFERRFLWRHLREPGSLVNLDDVKLSQIFESDDSTVFVWTTSVHSGARPLFRASGWMTLKRGSVDGAPAVVCHSCARVHGASRKADYDTQTRKSAVQYWTSAIRARQERICNRLLLLV